MISPCPFCGSDAVLTHKASEEDGLHMMVQCVGDGCWASIEEFCLDDAATLVIKRWNRRATSIAKADTL